MAHSLRVLRYVLLVSLALAVASEAIFAAETEEARRRAAESLFELPAYRKIATRQVYEAIQALPEEQYKSAAAALSDPKVVKAVREVIIRSMAQTFSVAELESLQRYLVTPEAGSMVDKTDAFQDALLKELLGAALTNPDLGRILVPTQ
jgi:hypothetical protein